MSIDSKRQTAIEELRALAAECVAAATKNDVIVRMRRMGRFKVTLERIADTLAAHDAREAERGDLPGNCKRCEWCSHAFVISELYFSNLCPSCIQMAQQEPRPVLLGVDHGAPGGDMTCAFALFGTRNPDGSITVEDVIYEPREQPKT